MSVFHEIFFNRYKVNTFLHSILELAFIMYYELMRVLHSIEINFFSDKNIMVGTDIITGENVQWKKKAVSVAPCCSFVVHQFVSMCRVG